MKDIKMFIYIMGTGIAITAFSFSTFATKDEFHRMEHKINQIYDHLLGKK